MGVPLPGSKSAQATACRRHLQCAQYMYGTCVAALPWLLMLCNALHGSALRGTARIQAKYYTPRAIAAASAL